MIQLFIMYTFSRSNEVWSPNSFISATFECIYIFLINSVIYKNLVGSSFILGNLVHVVHWIGFGAWCILSLTFNTFFRVHLFSANYASARTLQLRRIYVLSILYIKTNPVQVNRSIPDLGLKLIKHYMYWICIHN